MSVYSLSSQDTNSQKKKFDDKYWTLIVENVSRLYFFYIRYIAFTYSMISVLLSSAYISLKTCKC